MPAHLQLTLPELEQKEIYARLDGTFSLSVDEAFQRWYPYLEGYSSDFVRKTLKRYAPEAKTILDPFGGTGTTAFVASELGLRSYVCEVNPVLQLIFDVKSSVRCCSRSMRLAIGLRLSALLGNLHKLLITASPDDGLLQAYRDSFGESRYFSDDTLRLALQLRTVVDEVSASDPLVGQLLTVAAIASLLPASFLKRAGDVRFMTEKELLQGIPPLMEEIRRRLTFMKQDIEQLTDQETLRQAPIRLSGDARTLASIPPLSLDAVITSPPYINGTNYFRNTRLELWFLRCLRTTEDLGRLRRLAVTAGINDVTAGKTPQHLHPAVKTVVDALSSNAYDQRIPMMVGSYFSEMLQIFHGLSHHLKEDAVVAVDIGDSNYGGVHVPADRLLTDVLIGSGYHLQDEILLRSRRSKNGTPLRQVLLVYSFQGEHKSVQTRAPTASRWRASWASFRESLPHQQAPFSSRNWGSELHSLCSYPGKLKPAIAHHLVRVFTPEGGRVLDPFSGAGTIPFEAALNGRKAFGLELSPAAFPIAAAKAKMPSAIDTGQILKDLAEFVQSYRASEAEIREARSFGLNGKIAEYYHPDTLVEVLAARQYFLSPQIQSPSGWLVQAACLHILHGNRPYALSRRSHPLTPYKPTGPSEYRPLVPRLHEKVTRSLGAALPTGFVEGTIYLQDATGWWPTEVNGLDAVITSPPFFDSTRFHVQNWLRLWFAGWAPAAFQTKHKLFVDERQKLNFTVYESILRQSRDRLNVGGVVVLHLGKSAKCDMAKELARLAKRWFKHSEVFDESVAHCESHGVRDKGTVTAHQYLILY